MKLFLEKIAAVLHKKKENIMLELTLIEASLKIVDNLLTPKVVVDERAKSISFVMGSVAKKFELDEKQKESLEKMLGKAKLTTSKTLMEIIGVTEEQEVHAQYKLINLLLNQAKFAPPKKKAAEYASKVNFDSGNVDLGYLKTLLVAKQKYLNSKAGK